MQKVKLYHLLTPHTRINWKCIKKLNVSPETIKIVEEKQAAKSQKLHVEIFYQIYLLRQGKWKKKINKWDYIKLKSFCTAKENIHKTKRQCTEWENMFANTSDKGLVSKIFKELIKLNTKKTNNSIKKWAKDLIDIAPKVTYR